MSNINKLAIGDSTVNQKIVKEYGTFKLQDKDITENGKHYADVGFNGIRLANVNVSGGGGGGSVYGWTWTDNDNNYSCQMNFDKAPTTDELDSAKVIVYDSYYRQIKIIPFADWLGRYTYIRIDDDSFTVNDRGSSNTYTRNSSIDFTLWS